MEGLVYDFKVNNKKFQEKVGNNGTNVNVSSFKFDKNNGRVNGKTIYTSYNKGDNDFYWLNCKNNDFYVIPEEVLIDKGYINTNVRTNPLNVSKSNKNKLWINAYLFHYDNVDKERLLQIINS